MTKAKARARAKARAAKKAVKRESKDENPVLNQRPTPIDVKNNTMRNFAGQNIKSASGMRRGAARSR